MLKLAAIGAQEEYGRLPMALIARLRALILNS